MLVLSQCSLSKGYYANLLVNKNNYANTLRNEITQIEASISDRKNKLRVIRFVDAASKKDYEQETSNLEK